jgi:hypothetical protein
MFRRESLTRIVIIPFGNVLGVLLLFLLISPVFLISAIGHDRGRWVAALLPVASIAVVVIDVRIRRSRPDIGAARRWLSPYEGGNFFFVPGWLIGAAATAFFLVTLVVAFVRRDDNPSPRRANPGQRSAVR